ncbi:relaxase/mobilization nuclease domain-containing protein [Mesorhizobium sp. IMUNJ 23232]|uniref:relaxase/mobilization nuclease domain-containing protein n=1 Tax=Mesorhizobium sp. IMUNJ 23232 TaxID=3376064 RepID=UPI0037A2117D
MEFFPGAFEREWERRRAMLLHERQLGQSKKSDWDEPRRGGAARIGDEGLGGFGRARRRKGESGARGSGGAAGAAGRSMRTRFGALALGSQPAVVKLASYGGGARAGAMMSYASRGGEVAVENERGERVLGKDALAEQRAEWEHLFDNRTASRDLGVFHVSIDTASRRDDVNQDDQLREILRAGFDDRRFIYTARQRSSDQLYVSGVVVLRGGEGERLTGDRKAAEIVQQRFDDSDAGRDVEARFRFHGYGNGVEWGTARVRELVTGAEGEVLDDTGKLIGDATQAGDLIQKEWRKDLHSRKGRDVMHLIVSARAGTDGAAFEAAVREFLGEQFAGHRYVFAVHDPALDPKEAVEGGKRPHIHAHAIITMRSETGDRIVTSPQMFRDWRSVMAEKAREQGIDMELTDRREFASAPAYSRNQVRPISYRGRTEHEGTSSAAHGRYRGKRANDINLATTDRSREYTAAAAEAWSDLANEAGGTREGVFAMLQSGRLEGLTGITQNERVFVDSAKEPVKNITNMIEFAEFVNGEDGQMREMTRPEFEAYENRVEAVLSSVEQTLDHMDRADFDEIAAAAREVVDIRREYLEFTERQVDREGGQEPRGSRDGRSEDPKAQWNAAVARFGLDAVATADEVLVQVSDYRDGLDRIEAGELPESYTASYRAGIDREINRAAELAVDGDNQYIRETAKPDQDLQRAIDEIELSRAEQVRSDRGDDTDQKAASIDDDANRRAYDVFQGSAEAEQHRDPGREVRSTQEQDDEIVKQQAAMPSEQRTRHPDDRPLERTQAVDAEFARSDPPQQHVPRLRQIELELEERQDRDRDDRER